MFEREKKKGRGKKSVKVDCDAVRVGPSTARAGLRGRRVRASRYAEVGEHDAEYSVHRIRTQTAAEWPIFVRSYIHVLCARRLEINSQFRLRT